MKISSYTLALLAAAASIPFVADDAAAQATNLQPVRAENTASVAIRGYHALQLLGLETGVDAKDVRLVLSTVANEGRFLFRTDRNMARRFEQALGTERYADLVVGRPIHLHSPSVLEAARAMAGYIPGERMDDSVLSARAAFVVAAIP